MSSYSFSPQFYQHWTGAPDPVRAAIVQELTDITDLLQNETPFEKFVFSTHDLDAHLDDLYCAHDLQQAAAKELADKQVQQVAEKQKLEEEQRKFTQEVEDKAKEEQRQQAESEQQQIKTAQVKVLADTENTADNSNIESESSNLSASKDTQSKKITTIIHPVKVITENFNEETPIKLTLKNPELNVTHEALISELEIHIDDYLTEQMLQMSENLKSWLRAEVSRQLAGKVQLVSSDVKKKS